jgi:hypothetical protein
MTGTLTGPSIGIEESTCPPVRWWDVPKDPGGPAQRPCRTSQIGPSLRIWLALGRRNRNGRSWSAWTAHAPHRPRWISP